MTGWIINSIMKFGSQAASFFYFRVNPGNMSDCEGQIKRLRVVLNGITENSTGKPDILPRELPGTGFYFINREEILSA